MGNKITWNAEDIEELSCPGPLAVLLGSASVLRLRRTVAR